MESRVAVIYKYKICSTPIRQADLRLSHLHWDGIKDKNLDAHFDTVEEQASATASPAIPAADMTSARQKSGPSLGVLVISLGLLAVMGVVYVITK